MARFPSVPGGGPKGMRNPIYWMRMHMQDQRYLAKRIDANNRFNEKWKRLWDIHDAITENFIQILEGKAFDNNNKVITKINQLNEAINDARDYREQLNENLNACKYTDLAKYATKLKKLALHSINLCIIGEIYSDLFDVEYDSKEKIIYVNQEQVYFLG